MIAIGIGRVLQKLGEAPQGVIADEYCSMIILRIAETFNRESTVPGWNE